ncbi:Piwi domain-containing protein [Entamoeba marina]
MSIHNYQGKDYSLIDSIQYEIEQNRNNSFSTEFLNEIPKPDIDDSSNNDQFVYSTYHIIKINPNKIHAYNYVIQPEFEATVDAHRVIRTYFTESIFFSKDIIYTTLNLSEINIETPLRTYHVTFKEIEIVINEQLLIDLVQSILHTDNYYQLVKRQNFSSTNLLTYENDQFARLFDIRIVQREKEYYVFFTYRDAKIGTSSLWEQWKTLSLDEIKKEFKPQFYFNKASNRVEWISEIRLDINPTTQTFIKEEVAITVYDYYKNKEILITDQKQPILIQKQPNRGINQLTFFVPELIYPLNFPKFTETPQIHDYNNFFTSVISTINQSSLSECWNLNVSQQYLQCQCHQLLPTQIHTRNGIIEIDPNTSIVPIPPTVLYCPPLNYWVVYTTRINKQISQKLIHKLESIFNRMNINEKPPKFAIQQKEISEKKTLSTIAKSNPQIVISPFRNDNDVRIIKDYFDQETTIPTQCFDALTPIDNNSLQGIAEQIIVKIGGSKIYPCNSNISSYPTNTIDPICLIAVQTKEFKKKLIVCVSISKPNSVIHYDYRYYITSLTSSYSGIGLSTIIQELLKGRNPQKIFFYRNSVSERCFNVFLKFEIANLINAIKSTCGIDIPLCVMAIENVSSQFLIPSSNGTYSCPPGAIYVTTPLIQSFFRGFELHVKPQTKQTLRCIVLHDTTQLSLQEVVQITYDLCHLRQFKNTTSRLPICCYTVSKYCSRITKMNIF